MEQHKDYIQSIENITLSCYKVSGSMTTYMSEVDRKLLSLYGPNSTPHTTQKAPSTTSAHTPDNTLGINFQLIPGYYYGSHYGNLNCLAEDNISSISSTRDGVILDKLVHVIGKRKPLESLCRRDLAILVERLKADPNLFSSFASEIPANKTLRDYRKRGKSGLKYFIMLPNSDEHFCMTTVTTHITFVGRACCSHACNLDVSNTKTWNSDLGFTFELVTSSQEVGALATSELSE